MEEEEKVIPQQNDVSDATTPEDKDQTETSRERTITTDSGLAVSSEGSDRLIRKLYNFYCWNHVESQDSRGSSCASEKLDRF